MCRWTYPDLQYDELRYVCFNDECGYYVRGWAFIEEHYKTKASYRHMLDPQSGQTMPLRVKTAVDFRDGIEG